MINWETIKSLYNDKPTLLQWLKKVEAALSGATLTSVSVNTISVGVITLTFNFDDGTSITTPNINLPQGAQGVSITGAAIVAGKLILTLSNGTTIDAGNTGAVLGFEIDASQHLIVKYQDGTSEDLGAIFTGNVNITGNLSVGGNITNTLLNNTEDVLRGAADISSYYVNEGDIDTSSLTLPEGVEFKYAHWRVSNGKLSIVLLLHIPSSVTGNFTFGDYTFAIPAFVGSKIIPVTLGSNVVAGGYTPVERIDPGQAYGVPSGNYIGWDIRKANDTRFFVRSRYNFAQVGEGLGRIEINFIL